MKILVRGTNWIGDAVMSIPAMRELRRVFPDARITLHTRSWAEGLFTDASFIDEIVPFEKSSWTIRDVYHNSRFLRPDGYDLVVVFPNSFESAITSLLSAIPRRIGYNRDLRGLLLTDPVAVPEWKGRRHEVYYYLHLVAEVERRVLGRSTISLATADTTVDISDERKTAARQRLARAGVYPDRKTVAMGVGSTNSMAKRWPSDRYAQLKDMLRARLGANVVLLGSANEHEVSEIVASSGRGAINLAGKTDLGQAAALLSVVDLFISNDMGLAHVADAVGTPTITIFGPTNAATTRPFSENSEILRKDVECSPCMLRDCPIDHRCMTRLTVEEVFEAAEFHLMEEQHTDVEATRNFS